jgi:hypothetical protein
MFKTPLMHTILCLGMVGALGCAAEPEEEVNQTTTTGETPYYGCWDYTGWSSWTGAGSFTEWKERNSTYGGRIGRAKIQSSTHDASATTEMYLNYGPASASGFKLNSQCKDGSFRTTGLLHYVLTDYPATYCGDVPGTSQLRLQVLAAAC